MRQTPANDYLEEISTELPEEIYGRLSDAIYETTCDFDEEVGLLKDENAKLRELLSSYWKAVHSPVTPNIPRDYLKEMRELGIEVD